MILPILVVAGLAMAVLSSAASGSRGMPEADFERCWAVSDSAAAPLDSALSPQRWNCGPMPKDAFLQRLVIRFEPSTGNAATPRYFTARLGSFDRLTLVAEGSDGRRTAQSVTEQQYEAMLSGPYFASALPRTAQPPTRFYAVFDGIAHNSTFSSASLRDTPPNTTPGEIRAIILLTILLGAMLTPLFYDLVFFRVLRERFMLWHGALIGSFMALLALRSGLVNALIPLTSGQWRSALIVMFGVAVGCALMFTRAFLEDRLRHPLLSRIIPFAAAYGIAISVVHAASFEALRPLGGAFHTYALAPLIVLFGAVLADATRRGSRLVWFLWFGWSPLLLATSYQLASYLVPALPLTEALPLFYVGLICETAATALGVADRFMAIKNSQIAAELRAREAHDQAKLDPLTGLLNRRALAERFEEWRHQGFDTMAVLDLDRFKAINDDFGHGTGDQVLAAIGTLLTVDDDCVAIRLGGEEFLLLLRGPGARDRAERLRQSIPTRIAHAVPALDRMVTASMGLIELPQNDFSIPLNDLYIRADQLLYEAKQAGRNRLAAEKLTIFRTDGRRKRRDAA